MSSTFFIDPRGTIRSRQIYSSKIGRNFYEVLRIIDSITLYEYYNVYTKANWKYGDDVIIPKEIDNNKTKIMYQNGVTTKNSYYRTIKTPDK